MTTLQEYRDDYYEFSKQASDVSRKLAFAGIAVIWIFKADLPDNSYALAPELFYAGIAIVASLTLDLLHYGLSSLIWGWFWRHKEKTGVKLTDNLDAPSYFNRPALVCFWGKLATMTIAYGYLSCFLYRHVVPMP
jgi:hypothetical protein